ncbi:hypothetical protein E2320_005804 [Naja naja]|nr:hypothetical protein E2320_005804 [Naja naja]
MEFSLDCDLLVVCVRQTKHFDFEIWKKGFLKNEYIEASFDILVEKMLVVQIHIPNYFTLTILNSYHFCNFGERKSDPGQENYSSFNLLWIKKNPHINSYILTLLSLGNVLRNPLFKKKNRDFVTFLNCGTKFLNLLKAWSLNFLPIKISFFPSCESYSYKLKTYRFNEKKQFIALLTHPLCPRQIRGCRTDCAAAVLYILSASPEKQKCKFSDGYKDLMFPSPEELSVQSHLDIPKKLQK